MTTPKPDEAPDRKDVPARENAQSSPVELEGGNPSEVDRLYAATSGQGEVKPDDYPADERAAQVEAATGRPALKR